VTENPSAPAPPRTADQIKADITATQQRLAGTVDDLNQRLSPESLLRETGDAVKGVFVRPDGSVKGRSVAIAAGTVVGLIVVRQIFSD
jgi:hypothetical protein